MISPGIIHTPIYRARDSSRRLKESEIQPIMPPMKSSLTSFAAAIALSLMLSSAVSRSADASATTVTLDSTRTTMAFEGIGAVSAGASSRLLIDYPEPSRSHILDWLFLPKYGASFQHLKVEVGGEINSTDGTEPTHARSREELDNPGPESFNRGYEWWLMKEAKKRNPNIILDCLPWGAPGWIGNSNYCSQDMADYLAAFIKGGKEFHNLDINLVGGWNEKEVTPEWIKLLRRTLDSKGLAHVNIVGGDMNGPPAAQWKIAEQAVADPELARCLYAIGVHYPYGEVPASVARLRAGGLRTWSSEHGEWDWSTMLPFQHKRAASINNTFIERGLTKINFWSLVTSYYDCLPAPRSGVITANTPWSGAFQIAPTLWAVAHFTQFVEPGWLFLEGFNRQLPKGGSVVGMVSPDKKDFSMVIETTEAKSAQVLLLKAAESFAGNLLHVWRTDMMEQFIPQLDLAASNNAWTVLLDPNCIYSVTTTKGQRKGTAVSPPPKAFPLPYQDDFEGYQPNSTPSYLCDQGGAFEVVTRNEGGQCLRQQVHRPGIDWARASYAYSVIGDDNWNDIEVRAEACFETPSGSAPAGKQSVGLLCRWNPGSTWAHFTTPNPAGYNFRLYDDGRWELTTARKVLAVGNTSLPDLGWHQLMLKCAGDRITASLNAVTLVELQDSTYHRGLVGITSRFHPALFDNLIVTIP
jgi:hypothetical protein